MRDLRLFLLWLLALWAQLLLAPQLRWLRGFPDFLFLSWVAALPHLQGRRLWFWTLWWAGTLGWLAGEPFWIPLVAYLALVVAWWWLHQRLWERLYPLLFAITLVGTITLRLWEYLALSILGYSLPWAQVVSWVLVPGLFWNLLLVLPVYTVASSLLGPYPVEET